MAQMAQNGTTPMGNAKPSAKKRKWCFNINNWSENEYQIVHSYFMAQKTICWIIGKEKGEKEETPHIQCYVHFKNGKTFDTLKKAIPRVQKLQWCKGSDHQNYIYCSKDMDYECDGYPEDFHRQILKNEYSNITWKTWQQKIINLCSEKPHPRKIHWYWDKNGNNGKSFLAKYLGLTKNVILGDGKTMDINYKIAQFIENKRTEPNIILLDIPRFQFNIINYGALENIKNGIIASNKYKSIDFYIHIPVVIIFANNPPLENTWSKDRYDINEIKTQ